MGLSQEEEVGQDRLNKEDGGDAEGEFPFLRFVPEEIHPQECADTASCDRHPDEGRLRYAPLPSAGLPFVDSEDKEGQDIDADEIYDDCSQDHLAVTPINANLPLSEEIDEECDDHDEIKKEAETGNDDYRFVTILQTTH